MRSLTLCAHPATYPTLRAAREAAQMPGAAGMPYRCPECKAWVLR